MFALDDRTGNVLTTIALFAAVAAMAYVANATIVVFVLALLLAYLLEPLVAWLERRLPLRLSSRTIAIAVVYLAGAALAAGTGYAMGPAIAAQWRRLAGAARRARAVRRFGIPRGARQRARHRRRPWLEHKAQRNAAAA